MITTVTLTTTVKVTIFFSYHSIYSNLVYFNYELTKTGCFYSWKRPSSIVYSILSHKVSLGNEQGCIVSEEKLPTGVSVWEW